MMKTLLVAFALTTSLAALPSVPAYAQSTDQTDQSEEDWRKSRKKRDTSDIFEDIKNSTGFGSGINQGPVDPVDSLPEDSRRHLMKERARVIATVETGQTPDAPYSPSESAKTDPDLAEQEKEAWDVIMTDLKGTGGQGQAGTGPNKIAIAGQGGGNSPSNSTMRGGSSQSVAEILAQIKGLKSGSLGGGPGTSGSQSGSGQGPPDTGGGSEPSGQPAGNHGLQGQQNQVPQDAGQSQGQGQVNQSQAYEASAEASGESRSPSDQDAQSGSDTDSNSNSSAEANAQSDASSDSASADAAKAADDAATQAETQAQIQTQPDPIGPLDRLKKDRTTSDGVGSQTSATDFLKKSEKPD